MRELAAAATLAAEQADEMLRVAELLVEAGMAERLAAERRAAASAALAEDWPLLVGGALAGCGAAGSSWRCWRAGARVASAAVGSVGGGRRGRARRGRRRAGAGARGSLLRALRAARVRRRVVAGVDGLRAAARARRGA